MGGGGHDEDGFPVASAANEGTIFVDEFEVVWVCEYEPDLGEHVWRSLGPPRLRGCGPQPTGQRRPYPSSMSVRGYLTAAEVAERLHIDEEQAISLIRRRGPVGVVRTNDVRLLVPEAALDELRRDDAAP